jgi:hypothetical protein
MVAVGNLVREKGWADSVSGVSRSYGTTVWQNVRGFRQLAEQGSGCWQTDGCNSEARHSRNAQVQA